MMKRWHGALVGLAAVLMVVMTMQTVQAQRGRRGGGAPGGAPGGARGSMMGGMGGMMGGGSELALLRLPEVQKELDLLKEQVDDLTKINEDQRNVLRDLFSQMRNMSQEERTAKMRGAMEGIQKKVDDVLLPNQAKRLKQLALQQRLRGGISAALRDDKLVSELGISAAEKEKIDAKAAELEEQMRKQITELRKKAQDELMKTLTPPQQAKLKDMLGEPFEFQAQPRPQPGAAGGNFGNRRAGGGRAPRAGGAGGA